MDSRDITQSLARITAGDRQAIDLLFPAVYDELRRIAQRMMRREPANATLEATALVHEAYSALVDQTQARFESRAHFLSVASQALRRILIDAARRRSSLKRGGDRQRITLGGIHAGESESQKALDLLELDDRLRELQEDHPERARVVEMRFYGGMTHEEIAAVLGTTTRTVERYWAFARAWLFQQIEEGRSDPQRQRAPSSLQVVVS